MTRQAYVGRSPRIAYLAVLSAAGLLACASPATTGNTGGSNGSGTGGSHATGGGNGTGTGGSNPTGTGGSNPTGTGGSNPGTGGVSPGTGGTNSGSGGSHTGGSNGTGGTNPGTGGSAGGTHGGGGNSGCPNTDAGAINEDASGYICGNQWGIKGAWYCYTSDTSNACNKTGAIPWNASSNGMCLSGTADANSTVVLGFKVNSGPPGGGDTPGSWDASKIVGFAITLASGASGKGSGGSVVYIEYPTTKNTTSDMDAPGVTVPGVAGTPVTYNALFSDAVLANNPMAQNTVDAANLTDVKLTIPKDTTSHPYDLCITKVVPLMAAPSPVVASGPYGPAWSNSKPQAINGINGYAVQSTPFNKDNGLPMTMQVMATSGGVGFTYTAKSGASGNTPESFPAVISGWGPGVGGIQFYGPYKGGKTIGGANKLTSVVSNWSFTMGSSGDAAYDVWFGNSANPAKPQTELMIWIGNAGGKHPLGNSRGTMLMGRTAYEATGNGNGTGQQVISYWLDSPGMTSVSNFDLLPYFQDAASHSYAGLSDGSFLLGVQAGFEVYSGDTWKTTDYNISIK